MGDNVSAYKGLLQITGLCFMLTGQIKLGLTMSPQEINDLTSKEVSNKPSPQEPKPSDRNNNKQSEMLEIPARHWSLT